MNVEMNITTIREYQPTDKNAVIDLIRQNTPAYFAPKEEADFSNYLDSERELYFVLLLNKKVVGCGGINFTKDKLGYHTSPVPRQIVRSKIIKI